MCMISFSHNHPKVVHSDDAVAAAADVPTPAVTAALTRGVLSYIKTLTHSPKWRTVRQTIVWGFYRLMTKRLDSVEKLEAEKSTNTWSMWLASTYCCTELRL